MLPESLEEDPLSHELEAPPPPKSPPPPDENDGAAHGELAGEDDSRMLSAPRSSRLESPSSDAGAGAGLAGMRAGGIW